MKATHSSLTPSLSTTRPSSTITARRTPPRSMLSSDSIWWTAVRHSRSMSRSKIRAPSTRHGRRAKNFAVCMKARFPKKPAPRTIRTSSASAWSRFRKRRNRISKSEQLLLRAEALVSRDYLGCGRGLELVHHLRDLAAFNGRADGKIHAPRLLLIILVRTHRHEGLAQDRQPIRRGSWWCNDRKAESFERHDEIEDGP